MDDSVAPAIKAEDKKIMVPILLPLLLCQAASSHVQERPASILLEGIRALIE